MIEQPRPPATPPATAVPPPPALAAEPERWIAPSTRLLALRRTEVAIAGVVGILAASALTARHGAVPITIAVAAVVCGTALLALLAARRYRSWGYCERSRDLLVRRGVMFRRLTVVPYGRMQLVDVKAGLAERLFGLSTVALHTAAAATDARIPGLEAAEATRLRDRLAALGEAQAAGV